MAEASNASSNGDGNPTQQDTNGSSTEATPTSASGSNNDVTDEQLKACIVDIIAKGDLASLTVSYDL
jgi:hypothetical protein